MSLVKIIALPGICKVDSDYSAGQQRGFNNSRVASGRYRDMNFARFVAGLPEKIAGWSTVLSSQMTGVPRGMKDWWDSSQDVHIAIGTNLKLYFYLASTNVFTDITPLRGILTGTLTNPYTTVVGKTITVNHTAHGLQTGDYVMLTASAAIGGVTVSGVFNPITRTDANNYTIQAISAPVTPTLPGGGSVTYTYYRITLTNPFTAVSGNLVTVTHANHGAVNNDFVTIGGATAIGGVTPSGEYQISQVTTNTYVITLSSAPSSPTLPGGGTPNFQYDINSGTADSIQQLGYGVGSYSGSQGYSQPTTSGIWNPARTWSIDSYGQQIIANPVNGGIYVWEHDIGGRAFPLYNAPSALAIFVTTERFLIALGVSTGTQMTIAWPDQNDDTNWTTTPGNTANSGRTIQGGGYFVGGIKVRDGVNLMFSNTRCFTLTYTGDNNVYANDTVGEGAGLIGPLGVCELGGVAYWWGDTDFWTWNGAVLPLPSDDVRDYVFRNMNFTQRAKFVAATNRRKKEIWFFYCSAASMEIDSYVIFHLDQQVWSIGGRAANGYTGTALQRTCWIDQGLSPNPIACDASGFMYNHEVGADANGAPMDSYLVFDPIDIANGDRAMDIMGFITDFERQTGAVSVSLLTRYYPNDPDTVDGPFAVADNDTNPIIDTRSDGKMAGFKIESNVLGGDYRLGVARVDVQPAGARR